MQQKDAQSNNQKNKREFLGKKFSEYSLEKKPSELGF